MDSMCSIVFRLRFDGHAPVFASACITERATTPRGEAQPGMIGVEGPKSRAAIGLPNGLDFVMKRASVTLCLQTTKFGLQTTKFSFPIHLGTASNDFERLFPPDTASRVIDRAGESRR